MTQPLVATLTKEIVELFQLAEKKIGLQKLQDNIPESMGHAISLISFVALGYFATQSSDKMALGAGFAAGMIFSYIDPTCGNITSLQKGAILPMDKKGYFAFQKVCLLAMILKQNYALPTGFLAGNAFFHYAASIKKDYSN